MIIYKKNVNLVKMQSIMHIGEVRKIDYIQNSRW